jgi:bifunctional UDP-N-acetylglucosamine pyrophosphorylase/glucosamine-1-phosphate N-acetyltransferase
MTVKGQTSKVKGSLKAVIFCAGLGTRLRPLTDTLPKPLIDVGGRSIIERTIEALPGIVSETVIVVGYKGGMIRERLAERTGLRFVEQPELRGTYDALLRAAPHLGEGPFLALNGDDLYGKEDLDRLAASVPFSLLAHEVPAPNPYSHLETKGGFLKRIILNKDMGGRASHLVYVGACLLDPRLFDLEPACLPNGECGLPQTLEKHLDKIPVQVLTASFWLPVGTPEEFAAARAALTAS